MTTLSNQLSQTTLTFNKTLSFRYLAETSSYKYNDDVYNSSIYNGNVSNNSNNGSLINTGTMAGLTVAIGGVLIFSAIFVKFWKRPNKKSKSLN